MIDVAADIKSQASDLQKKIIESYASRFGTDEPLDVTKLVALLKSKKSLLEPITKLNSLGILPRTRMRSSSLNAIYAALDSDVYMLFSAAGGLDGIMSAYKTLVQEKNDRIESKLREQEGRLSALKHLKDNPTHREAWAIDLQDNKTESDRPVVFNPEEQAVSLNVISSKLITPNSTTRVLFPGNPITYSMPGYGLDNITDHSKLTAWYNVVSYKTRPINYFDFTQDDPLVPASSTAMQLSGAVAVIEFSYTYPQSLSLVRIAPFSVKPTKIIGLYQKTNSGWSLVPGTNVGHIEKQAVLTFETVINTKFKLAIQQKHGIFTSITVDRALQDSNTVWDVIYAKEYNASLNTIAGNLGSYTQSEITKATNEDSMMRLLKQSELSRIQRKLSSTDSTADETKQDLDSLQKYVSSDPSQNVTVSRFIYELGLLEVELYNNQFRPLGEFVSTERTPKMGFTSCSLEAVEDLGTGASIAHSILTADGESLPIPNTYNVASDGSVVSMNEFIEVDHVNKIGYLRFVPLDSTIEVTRVYPNNTRAIYSSVPVTNQTISLIPGMYHQKGVFQTTYRVKEGSVDVESQLVSKSFTFTATKTSDGAFLELPKAPVIEYGIVNNSRLWRKRSKFHVIWDMVIDTVSWVETSKSFPNEGLVFDNTYYGPAAESPIVRTAALESFLLAMFTKYSSNPVVMVNRFFNKYTGTTLGRNMSYSPLTVKLNGKELPNLSNYDGSPDSGFIPGLGMEQYRHFESRLLFTQALSEVSIEAIYRIKETSLQYSSILYCNKNSEFVNTPLLRSVVLATE